MLRIAFSIFLLASLSAISVNGSPVPRAKTRAKAPAAATTVSSRKTAGRNSHKTNSPSSDKTAAPDPEPAVSRRSGKATSARSRRAGSSRSDSARPDRAAAPQSRKTAAASSARTTPSNPDRAGSSSSDKPGTSAAEKDSVPISAKRAQRAAAPVVADNAGYANGYKTGYAAGLAEARKQAAGANMCPASPSRRSVAPETDNVPSGDAAATPKFDALPKGRTVMPQPLRGSRESLQRQNDKLEAEGLERIEDEADLADRISHRMLVPVPASASLIVNGSLPVLHRYCRPWTARFVADLARAHAELFHRPLIVSSAVRTVQYQKRLIGINGNAAAAEGDIVSPHLTGATIDIAKQGLGAQEMAWMRRQLLELQDAGKIDVEEEFQQSCFHITVYKSYAPEAEMLEASLPTAGPGAQEQSAVAQSAVARSVARPGKKMRMAPSKRLRGAGRKSRPRLSTASESASRGI